jgi:hypothetical protein
MKDTKENLQVIRAGGSLFAIEVKEDNVRFNLTEMAKKHDLKPDRWLRTNESKSYIKCLALLQKCDAADLVAVRMGGKPHEQGTWANDYRIAIEFARWLDPMFSIQVNDLVWKILTGHPSLAHPIGGVWPLIRNGQVGYPRKEILEAAGYSSRSGRVHQLKKLYPGHHFTIARTACVSEHFARLRVEQGKVRQMELQFRDEAAKEMEEVLNCKISCL